MTTYVFIHGRNQQGKNPDKLRAEWTGGLNAGLTGVGAPTVDEAATILPFYGDVLHAAELRAKDEHQDIDLESVRHGRARIDPAMPEDVARAESAILREMYSTADGPDDGIDEESLWDEALLSLPGAATLLDWIGDHTHVAQDVIERFLTDVAVYLTVARNEVLDLVKAQVEAIDGELIIIAHSLGGAVARDLLETAAIRERTTSWLTAGSPLGLAGVDRNLLSQGPTNPGVPWAAVWDPQDIVALGHPLQPIWDDPLDDIQVDNPRGSAHSIVHYLGHPEVARWIAEHALSTTG